MAFLERSPAVTQPTVPADPLEVFFEALARTRGWHLTKRGEVRRFGGLQCPVSAVWGHFFGFGGFTNPGNILRRHGVSLDATVSFLSAAEGGELSGFRARLLAACGLTEATP